MKTLVIQSKNNMLTQKENNVIYHQIIQLVFNCPSSNKVCVLVSLKTFVIRKVSVEGDQKNTKFSTHADKIP